MCILLVAASGWVLASADGYLRYPDGKLIAFTGQYDGNADVFVVSAAGTGAYAGLDRILAERLGFADHSNTRFAMSDAPFVRSVLHPSDFSEASHAAFSHALAIALYRQASFTVLHVVPRSQAVDVWTDSPPVRQTLERWGLLEPGSPRTAVYEKLALGVSKINVRSTDPLKAILSALEERPADLIVLATEGRQGLPRWLKPSVAEGVARRSKTMSLFVPERARGIVSPADGSISVQRILVPVDHEPDPADAVAYAMRAAVMSHEGTVEISLLRVGREPDWPDVKLPELQSIKWSRIHREGDVVEQIVATADELSANLIVMGTAGAKGILGALRGSVTEQVLRQSPCCLLAVPDKRD